MSSLQCSKDGSFLPKRAWKRRKMLSIFSLSKTKKENKIILLNKFSTPGDQGNKGLPRGDDALETNPDPELKDDRALDEVPPVCLARGISEPNGY